MRKSSLFLTVLYLCAPFFCLPMEGHKEYKKCSNEAKKVASQMAPGWNLGNTMEATGEGLAAETSWQPTVTTRELIDFVKRSGFRSVRIPCSWNIHADTQGNIDKQWMARVKEIVDYCVNDGLYVVLNDHWDSGWIEVMGFSKTNKEFEVVDEQTIQLKVARLQYIWRQIAVAFKGYDEHLLFAGLNEPFQEHSLFHDKHKELTPILQRYNQAFVNAVRSTGGKNKKRILVVQAPGTNISSATNETIDFTMPVDPVGKGRLMVEVHYYDPWDFCGQQDGGKRFWGQRQHVEGSPYTCEWGEENWVASQFASMKKKFYDHGYPVILGEYGINWREIGDFQEVHDASVKAWYKVVTQEAISNGCVPMLWDINRPDHHGEKGTMTVIDRANLKVFSTVALDGIMEGVHSAKSPR
ncbi:MAG: glycoside hydrolase family 5 protein [Prevotella sp.]|nr:glycoside hydrolase family 5 protein [Prevotella sp.]